MDFGWHLWTVLVASAFAVEDKSATTKAAFSRKWHVLGPFVRGKTEHDGDPLEFHGGIANLKTGSRERFLSELAPGGYVGWTKTKTERDGTVQIPHGSVDFNGLIRSLSTTDVLNVQSWVVGEISIPEDAVYLIDCKGVHTMEIGGRVMRGNIYQRPDGVFPMRFSQGRHIVRIKVTGKVPLHFSCGVQPAGSVLALIKPTALPHVRLDEAGVLGSAVIGPLLRNAGDSWVSSGDIYFEVVDVRSSAGIEASVKLASEQPYLPPVFAPGLVQEIPLVLKVSLRTEPSMKDLPDADCVHFKLIGRLRLDSSEAAGLRLALRCRQRHQSFLFTFLDDDGSVSHAAAIRPFCQKQCSAAPLPILLTLAGVGVEPLSQADAHKRAPGPNKPFEFGWPNAWVLAPERGGPHNWEDWGPRTALRAIDTLVAATAGSLTAADASRLFVAGHSRGGHGAWNIAERVPDRCLAVAPISSWHSREQYADANTIFSQDTSLMYLDPGLKSILERTIIENDSAMLASNLKGMPILVRHGGADNTVPVYHGRRMARTAEEAGGLVTYSELEGKQHWWWDTKKTNDGGPLHDDEMRNFTGIYLKDGVRAALPQNFRITIFSPSTFHGRGGVRPLQTTVPLRRATVDVELERGGRTWLLKTVNVRRLELQPSRETVSASIDGQVLDGVIFDSVRSGAHICRLSSQKSWQICSESASRYELHERGPSTWGPARQVVQSRKFAIVTCTDSRDSMDDALAIADIARYMAHGHLMAVNSLAPILRQEDVSLEVRKTHNLVHVGLPDALLRIPWFSNSTTTVAIGTASLEREEQCPSHGCEGNVTASFTIGPCTFSHPRHGIVFTAPRIEEGHNRAFVDLWISGTDLLGLRDIVSFDFASNVPHTRAPFTNMVPDFLVSGPQFKAKGYGGLAAAGFWGAAWEWRDDSAYMEC